MTSSTHYSEINGHPRRTRGIRASKKSILYSDYVDDSEANNLGQRSISLTALPHQGPTAPNSGPLLEPRMAQLETLEAKMASIEVSLSTSPRRKNGKKNGVGTGTTTPVVKSPGSTVSAVTVLNAVKSHSLVDTCRELELLKNALKDKENTIQNLQGQMSCCNRLATLQPLDQSERRAAEVRLQHLKQEEEARKSAIKKIDISLEQIDSAESNIDVRIRQAELEYELGREELGLLGVREEFRTLQARLDAKPTPTLYSCVAGSTRYLVLGVQLEYDPKSPRFGAGTMDDKVGLFVVWAAEDSGFQKGDRILEVNGKLTLSTSKEEMLRLLTVCPSKAEVVVRRLWTPPPSTEDLLRRENLRLTHRISYLEDQVTELITQREHKPVEVFQKGSQVTLLSSPEVSRNIKHSTTVSISSRDSPVGPGHKYSDAESYQSFQPKLHNTGDKIKALSKKYEKDEFSSTLTRKTDEEEGKKRNVAQSRAPDRATYSLSDLERCTRKWGAQYYNKAVDYSSESSCPRYRPHTDRSVKSLDLDADQKKHRVHEQEHNDLNKPTPPRKPIRLSIHRATSLQSVELGYSLHNAVRKLKRSHKGEAPQPPGETRTPSKTESGRGSPNESSRSAGYQKWTGHYHRNRSKHSSGDEKWC